MLDVLLVHAYPFDARLWEPQLRAAPPELRLHTLDLPGFGQAPPSPLPVSMDALAAAIHEASRPFARFALVGISMGGYAAFAHWRRFGHEGRLVGLVLADTKAEADTAEGKAGRDDTVKLIREQGLAALATRLLPKLLSSNADEATVRRARALIESQRPETVIAATLAMRDRPDSTELLPSMQVPVLAMGGELDVLTPPTVMQAMTARLPGAQWQALPRAAHLSNLDQPERFNEVLFAFLRALPQD